MSKEYKKNKKLITNFILMSLIMLSTCFLAIGYAGLNPITLDITGEVTGTTQEGIYIAEVKYVSNNGANLELSNINQCNGTTMGSEIVLSSTDSNSNIKYSITVYNRDAYDYFFDDVIYNESFFSNENITFSLSGIELGDMVKAGGEKTFYITFKYDDSIEDENLSQISNKLNSVIKFDFEKVPTPVLASNMIPVYYESGMWKKADSLSRSWYNYQQGKWANAVTYDHSKVYNESTNIGDFKQFNGTSDYITLGNANYNFGKNISVIVRFKVYEHNSELQYIVSNIEDAGFYIGLNAYNKIIFRIKDDSGDIVDPTVRSANEIQTNTWYTVVATYDGNLMKLYVNGALESTLEYSNDISASQAPIVISGNPRKDGTVISTFFKGAIAEVGILKDVLQEDEIIKYYNSEMYHAHSKHESLYYLKFDADNPVIINDAKYGADGMSFNGVDNYVSVGLSSYDFKNNYTIGARFKINEISTNAMTILGNPNDAGIYIEMSANNKIRIGVYDKNTSKYISLYSNNQIELDIWYTVVATYDGSVLKLFINGKEENSLEQSINMVASDVPITIGANANIYKIDGSFFKGKVSEVIVVDEALTNEQISTYYQYDLRTIISDKTLISCDLRNYESRAIGTTIPDKMINTMWVWIPRFYAKTPTNNAEVIDIDFAATDDAAHDAFTIGGQQISGFWVGKFENTAKGVPINTSTLERIVEIIPNRTSWRYTNLSTKYNSIKNMKATNNLYGFGTSVDPHLIKNNEWAAVAYFTNTKYGICSDNRYVKVSNNGTTYKTGGDNYLNNTSQSTTGNVYGVYDMNGGASEYVMGNYGETIGESGFNSIPGEQYINTYTTEEIYINNNLQHALLETNGLYGNPSASFVNETSMWQVRDDLFSYINATGGSSDNIGSRTVLVIQ